MPTYVGVDPGASGGIVMLDDEIRVVECTKMPATERDVMMMFRFMRPEDPVVMIEWIHPAIFGVGKSSMSKLYGNYMSLRMAIIAADLRMECVKPRAWQQAMGVTKRSKTDTGTKWKNTLKAAAQELYPDQRVTLATADALLIATHCYRTHSRSYHG